MEAPIYQVDAFTTEPFRGNPAAVCLMPCDLDDALYQSIAAEMNLSETAFVQQLEATGEYRLRWFTPVREVSLCGHATLATAHVLFNHAGVEEERLTFHTLSGALFADRAGDSVRMDFPRNDPVEVEPIEPILNALGLEACDDFQYSITNQKLLVLLGDSGEVTGLQPDFDALHSAQNTMGWRGVIATAEGTGGYDFVSRYFAPWMGIDEDPVTGSAHTVLGPYWARRLGKKVMRAYQSSERGGELLLELHDERIDISGESVTVFEGRLRY